MYNVAHLKMLLLSYECKDNDYFEQKQEIEEKNKKWGSGAVFLTSLRTCVPYYIPARMCVERYCAHISAQRSPSTPAETMPPA